MCGIVGFTGHQSAKDTLIEGLRRLEYRGYDSAGIALQNATNEELTVVHRVGKVAGLAEAVEYLNNASPCGIGHTRWATHGAPSERNAHPHTSCDNQIAVVHNGIIENFAELREQLEARGHKFRSDTDTEVVSHLIEEAYRGNLRDAVAKACSQIVGTYGLAVICSQEPGRIVVTRKDSPIVLAHGEKGSYVASDIIAVIEASRDVTVLGDNEFAVMEPDGISYTDADGNPIQPKVMHVDWDVDVVEKGGYPDFMLKEIHEQPRVIRDTLAGRLTNGVLSIDELGMSLEQLRLIDRVYIIACGTSYHAGLIARQLIEGWARIPVEVEAASEFRYRNPIIT
ncbi:MAG: glutamine--fructose-6-phosphate transaminase (isomerizing), partial [Prevotella salivae]|nr:glutamine--fructose-6-phosphate transaminase (isomerizing) [Segatella salivae]